MNIKIEAGLRQDADAVMIPFDGTLMLQRDVQESLPEKVAEAVRAALDADKLSGGFGAIYAFQFYNAKAAGTDTEGASGTWCKIVLLQIGDETHTNRERFLAFARAFKACKDAKAAVTAVLLDNVSWLSSDRDTVEKLMELPYLCAYQFNFYKSVPVINGMEEAVFVTKADGLEPLLKEAFDVAESTTMARDLVNHPSMFMTPKQFAQEAEKLAREEGLSVTVLAEDDIRAKKMGAFLSVAKGASEKPFLIVLRYQGGKAGDAPLALIGKGVMFDSGGYSLKSKMATMHDDMGGAAAVMGAIRAIARQKLPVNVIAVMAACENMVSGDAYVPGDILFSMNGKTIEMLNADAEGRLTLADAITYAIREEGAAGIIDIATLTGAAKGAVGKHSAAVLADDETLYGAVSAASAASCEKIWRLPLDRELFDVIRSDVADIKNANPGNPMGGGTIVAGLFIQSFAEGHPWCHIDMAPVNWLPEGNAYCIRGGTGYGVSLLYQTVKRLCGVQ